MVKLDWPQAGIVLTMTMANIDVNPTGVPTEVWGLPQIPGYPVMDLGASFPPQQAAMHRRPARINSRIAELKEPDWSDNSNEEPKWKPAQVGFEESTTFPVNETQTEPLENPFRKPDSFDPPAEAPGRVKL